MNIMSFAQTRPLKQNEVLLLEKALNALRETAGLQGKVVPIDAVANAGMQADAAITLELAGKPRPYLVEIKRIDRLAALGQVKNQLDRFAQPGVLITHYLTAEMADKCRELGVQFMDAQGNAFLQGPDWLVLVKGQRPPAKTDRDFDLQEAPGAGTATALRTIFALLCHPKLLNAPYREIKQAAGVALGGIGWVFFDLNRRGLTTGGQKKGDRHILEQQRMIEEWVINYPIKLRPKLNARRFHAENPDWWKQLDVTRYEAHWGGEVAAEKLTGHLKPNTVTLYMCPERMRQNLTRLVVDNKLSAAPDGEIEVLETFWQIETQSPLDTVPPLLVYADLLATQDPRNFNVGKMIAEQYLHATETRR